MEHIGDPMSHPMEEGDGKKSKRKRAWMGSGERARFSLAVFVVSLVIVVLICLAVYGVAYYAIFSPPALLDSSTVEVTIPKGSSVSAIGKLLEESGVIRSKTVFKVYMDFTYQDVVLQQGTYQLQRDMTVDEVVDTLSRSNATPNVATFTLAEGLTVEEMADLLVDKKIVMDREEFLGLCATGALFKEYTFVQNSIEANAQNARNYVLEGYLAPDTYEVYLGADAESIIRKMLGQVNVVFTEEYYTRADEMGLTMDQVITLASIIEKEAKAADFAKVSAVFHNRMDKNMFLQSCATVNYAKGIHKLYLSDADIAYDSPYNTYKYAGLPAGPICNPGAEAIQAALWPDEDYVQEGYLYFCNKTPESGELAFAKTEEQHQKNQTQYRQSWIDYDNKTAVQGTQAAQST